jgi:hypothetical protein
LGARTSPDADFQHVTPDALAKTRFVNIDAIRVTEHDYVDAARLTARNYEPQTAAGQAASLVITEDETATLASRLAAHLSVWEGTRRCTHTKGVDVDRRHPVAFASVPRQSRDAAS